MHLGRFTRKHCLSDGTLRAAIDNGVDRMPEVAAHLSICPRCRGRFEEIAGNSAFASRQLEQLAIESAPVDLHRARQKMHGRIAESSRAMAETQGESFVSTLWKGRALRGAVVMLALVLITTAFVSTPMRSLADSLFNRYEVERFEAITVGQDDITEFQTGLVMQALTADPQRLLGAAENLVEVESTFDTSNPDGMGVKLDSLDDARAAFGEFKAPADLPAGFDATPEIIMSEAGSITATVDTESVNVIAEELGLQFDALPDAAEMPKMVFTVDVPQALVLHYQADGDGHVMVGQLDSPTLTTPEGLDMNALRDDVLDMPGLSSNLVDQLENIDNWETTLVVPVPEGAETRDVTVNGEPGLVIDAGSFDGSSFGMDFELDGDVSVVMWSENGTLYFVAGTVNGDEIVSIAESLN